MFIRSFKSKFYLVSILILLLLIFTYGNIYSESNYGHKFMKYINYLKENDENVMQNILKCDDSALKAEKVQYGDYWLLKNYIIGTVSQNVNCGEYVTYTTQADYTFLDNLEQVIMR